MSDTTSTPHPSNALRREDEVRKHVAHATALGDLCMSWAVLDRTLDALIAGFLACSRQQTACVVEHIDNVGSRCILLKRLSYLEDVGDEWREWFCAVVDRISGELAPLRNRYVHDAWAISYEEIVRIDKRAKLVKPQARQPQEVRYDTRYVTDPADVEKLRYRILAVMAALALSEQSLGRRRKTGGHLRLDPLLLPVRKPLARYMTPLEHLQRLGGTQPPEPYVFD